MEITACDHLTQVKHLIIWKSWWKLYRLSVLFKGSIPTEDQQQWKIESVKGGLAIFTTVFNTLNVLTPNAKLSLGNPEMISLRAIHLYEVAWGFLKQYPFHEDAFSILHPFVFELENIVDLDSFLRPHLKLCRDAIQEEYNSRITTDGASIHPDGLFENAERLFYTFNLLLLAHKTCSLDLWQDTWKSNNIYLERATCIKKLEAVKRLYGITQEIATRPKYHSTTSKTKRSDLLAPVIIPQPSVLITNPALENQILEAKKSAEAIMSSNSKGHVRRSSGVSANLVMDTQNNKIGVGVVLEKKLRKFSSSKPKESKLIDDVTKELKKLHPEDSIKKSNKRLSWFKNELESNSSSSSEWGSTIDITELPQCFLEVFTLINDFTTAYCDYICRKSSPPPSPNDYIDNYMQSSQRLSTQLNNNFNTIISDYLFGSNSLATEEMQKVFLNVEILTLIVKTINNIMKPSDAIAIEENTMRIIKKKTNIASNEEFDILPESLKTKANHLGVLFHFSQNFRTLLTQTEYMDLDQEESPTMAYKNNMYRLSNLYIKELVRTTIESFIGNSDVSMHRSSSSDQLFTPRQSLGDNSYSKSSSNDSLTRSSSSDGLYTSRPSFGSKSNPSLPPLPQTWKRVTVSNVIKTPIEDTADEANSTSDTYG